MAQLNEQRIEKAWLEAARDGNIDQMKELRNQHPQLLDLNRNVHHSSSSDGSQPLTGLSGWHGFHLSTFGASALYTATWNGDDKIIEYLLEEGQDPDTEDDSGMSAIMVAIMHHNLQASRCIFRDRVAIQRNLIIDCRQEDGDRTRRTVARLELFLRFNANLNKQCHRGKTALHYATTDDSYEVARLLVCSGAAVDTQDKEGKSPLQYCIQPPSLMVANLLLQHGANVSLPAIDGITPIQRILRLHDVTMLQIVLNHNLEVVTAQGIEFAGAVLLIAVDEEALPIITFLLQEGYASSVHQNSGGETPMHRALRNKSASVASLLRSLDTQARVLTVQTHSRESCLHYAAQYSTPRELLYLLEFYQQYWYDAEPLNRVNMAGRTALFLIATSEFDSIDNRLAKTRLMLTAGAKLLGSNPFVTTTQQQNMILSTEVHTCLCLWLSECAETHFDEMTQFSIDLLAIVCTWPHPRLKLKHEVLGVMLATGYAVDTMSLLILLPIDRKTLPSVVERIRVFGRQSGHALLLALYEELSAALTEPVA